jgi:asparagine synthase (glutamine-hydrolysing)
MNRIIGAFDTTKEINNSNEDLIAHKNILIDSKIEIFTFEDNKIFLSGKIYNKQELETKYNYKAISDADLILYLYLNFNFTSIKQINGEYTFVILTRFDTIICRDRHGCGLPIFYTEKYFSNSLNLLFEYSKLKKEVNIEAIATFLGLGYIPSPLSPIKYVKKMRAGSFLLYKHGTSVIESNLFDFEDFTRENYNKDESFDLINEKFNTLVQNAIDIREKNHENIELIDFQNITKNYPFKSKNTNISSNYNKNDFIKHHEINNLPKIIRSFEIPFNDYNIIHNYLFFEKIKKDNPDILLNFNGIDYLLGTNASNISKYIRFKKNRTIKIFKLIKRILSFHFFDNFKNIYKFRVLINRILNIYIIGRCGFTKKQITKLFKSKFKSFSYKYQNSLPLYSNSFEDAFISHNYFIDIKQSLNEIETYQMSILAQNLNIQISYPLLDNNIYNFLKSIPLNYKININSTSSKKSKKIPYQHKNIINSTLKSDFFLHINQSNYLYDANLRKKLYNYMLNSDATKSLFNLDFLTNFFDNFEKEIINKNLINKTLYDLSFQFFNLLILNIWWDQFINNKKGTTLQDFY